ncbi:hypothetical protein B0H11DRAFT_1931112 [Mycena galericulata]|nr:hypothetical protein B0H11DRAFT_1931112 [Mycena galericulata]
MSSILDCGVLPGLSGSIAPARSALVVTGTRNGLSSVRGWVCLCAVCVNAVCVTFIGIMVTGGGVTTPSSRGRSCTCTVILIKVAAGGEEPSDPRKGADGISYLFGVDPNGLIRFLGAYEAIETMPGLLAGGPRPE